MTEIEQFNKIKDACISEGGKLLLQQIQEHKAASDTTKVVPLTNEHLMNRAGYVAALEWIEGLVLQYQNLTEEDVLASQEEPDDFGLDM